MYVNVSGNVEQIFLKFDQRGSNCTTSKVQRAKSNMLDVSNVNQMIKKFAVMKILKTW